MKTKNVKTKKRSEEDKRKKSEKGKQQREAKGWTGNSASLKPEIRRYFGDQLIIEAKDNIRVVILEDDIKKGIRLNTDNCVFAEACKRLFKSQKVLLCARVAYISMPDENGNYRVERFIISKEGRKLIADFDRGIIPKPGTGFSFRVPLPCQTLNYIRDKSRKYDEKGRQAKLSGVIINQETKKADRVQKPIQLDIRNGQGMVQMRIKQEKEAT